MAKPLVFNSRRSLHWSTISKVGACCLVVGAAACFSGCRAVDHAQVDVMERELRQQEDYIYELEDYVMEYSEKLRQCRSCATPMSLNALPTNAKPSPKGPTLADDSNIDPAPARRQGRRVASPPASSAPTIDAFELPPNLPAPAPASSPATGPATAPAATPPAAPPTAPTSPEDLEAPGLEIGPTTDLPWKGAAPIATAPAGDEAPPFIPDPADYQIDADDSPAIAKRATVDEGPEAASSAAPLLAAPELIAASPTVSPPNDAARLTAQRLQIRRVLGPAPNTEGGADGANESAPSRSLLVVVEALNATDEPVDANGEVSLMVMTGETQETLRPIERWDFTAEEAIAAWQSSQLGDGLHLELPLGAHPLPEGKLELWARLVNADGAKLLTKVPFAASDLKSLDEAMADEALAEKASVAEAPQADDSVATQSEPQSLGANGDAVVVDGKSLNEVDPAAVAAAPQPVKTQWRSTNEPLDAQRVESFSSTAGGASGGWTRQPPGRMPAPAVARTATGSDARPRWQQGSNETPQPGEPGGVWAPFR